jgi:hypothetical protein
MRPVPEHAMSGGKNQMQGQPIHRVLQPHIAAQAKTPEEIIERAAIREAMLNVQETNPIPQHVLEMSLQPADVVHIRKQTILASPEISTLIFPSCGESS